MARHGVIVIGGGSGGIGASLAAARLGADVCLIEAHQILGGTSTVGGVNVWEMGSGGTGIPFDLYLRMKQIACGVGIYTIGRHAAWAQAGETPYPGGESIIDPTQTYADTLRRCGARSLALDEEFARANWHGVVFEPDALNAAAMDVLAETQKCTVLLETRVHAVNAADGRIESITLSDGTELAADVFIDSTGDGFIAAECGCEMMSGQEARDAFDEPGAPERPTDHLNGVSLIYRIMLIDSPAIEALPDAIAEDCWWQERWPSVSAVQYPCGDWQMNTLPTMAGREYLDMGLEAAYEECRRRVLAHWHYLQTEHPEFRAYRLKSIAPALGVRETRRVVGDYVLTEHDVRGGLSNQQHDDIIAISDHMIDTHGAHAKASGELEEPYGIPYRCLLAKGMANLLVACRAASFSSIAASSCRLSRTMMQLGQAAGTAASMAATMGITLRDVAGAVLRYSVEHQGTQLTWLPSEDVVERIGDE
jgi:hypothetical protein